MNRSSYLSLALAGLSALPLLLCAPARAQIVSIPVFRGQVDGGSNVRLSSWGSGRAETDNKAVIVGDSTIKITTQGLYQGGRIDFPQPIDLTQAFRNGRTYMRFQVRFTGGGAPQQQAFDEGTLQTTNATAAPFERMRFVLVMADGTQHELIRPLDLPPSEDPDSYQAVSFPLAALLKPRRVTLPGGNAQTPPAGAAAKAPASAPATIPSGAGAQLRSIAVFGDKYQQFYIGDITILTDATDINVADMDEPIAARGQQIALTGSAEGGASSLRFTWDFDDKDGIQEDAEGRNVRKTFDRAGKYTVTLTVSDVDGLKKPQKTTIVIDVFD